VDAFVQRGLDFCSLFEKAMKKQLFIPALLIFISCNMEAERERTDMDTVGRQAKEEMDTIIDRFTDAVDSTTDAILDSARSKGPRLIKKGEKAVERAIENLKDS